MISTLTAVAAFGAAVAQPTGYAFRTRTVNAGVVVIRSNGYANLAPHIWGNLDGNDGVKPAGWFIQNPVGNGRLTATAAARWGVPNQAVRLGKTEGPYWEVVLDTVSQDTLNRYDILALPAGNGSLILNPSEREKLRQYIDQGGVLWVDLADGTNPVNANAINTITPLPAGIQVDGSPRAVNTAHPLMSQPNQLGLRDVAQMSWFNNNFVSYSLGTGDFGSASPLTTALVGDSAKWDTVVQKGVGRAVASARVGDGYIVFSTEGIMRALNLGWNGATFTANTAFSSEGPVRSPAFDAASKLAINAISLGDSSTMSGTGSRGSNSTAGTVGAPAIKQSLAAGSYAPHNKPALFGGRIIVTSGNQVGVYDAKPGRDLNGDGNPDDGVQEPVGQPSDLIWSSQALGGALSAPTVVEVPNSALGPSQQVFVHDSNGNVHVFDLNATGTNIAPVATIAPPPGVQTGGLPTPVTVQDGMGFVSAVRASDQFGMVWSFDVRRGIAMANGANRFAVYGSSRLRRTTGAPTVGYIPVQDSSGGLDRVAYVPTGAQNNQAASVVSVWVGARGEAPTSVTKIPNAIRINTRASLQRLPVFLAGTPGFAGGLTLNVINAVGQPMSVADLQNYFDGSVNQVSPGVLEFGLTAAGEASGFDWDGTNNAVPDIGYRLDYTIDWSGPQAGSVQGDFYVRGNIDVADQGAPTREIVGSPALSPSGTIGITVRNNDTSGSTGSSGSFYLLKEDGRGDFLVRTRWEFHDAITTGFAVAGRGAVPYPGSITDIDGIVDLIPFLNAPIVDATPTGPPSVRGDMMFVTVTGVKNLFGLPVPTTTVLAFDSNPPVPEVEIPALTNQGGNQVQTNVIIKQPDMARSTSEAAPAAFSAMASNAFSIELIPNTNRAKIRFESMSTVRRGPMSSCIANNLPIIVQWPGQTETLIEPEALEDSPRGVRGFASGTFSHLQWYSTMQGYQAVGPAVVTGENIFLAGSSILPSLITVGPVPPFQPRGLLFAMRSDVSGNDEFFRSTPIRPWQRQFSLLNGASPFNFAGATFNQAFLWPQSNGIEEFDDFRIRVLQATLVSDTVSAMSAGDGSIAAVSPTSLEVFARADFYVADAGRISRFDPSGNPLWSTESTLFAGQGQPVGAASDVRKFSEPNRVYPTGANGYVVVDSGNDVISQIDAAGREVRSIRDIRIHPSNRPAGTSPNEARVLRKPMDVQFWSSVKTAAQVAAMFPGETLEAGASAERWDHWLIADAGNSRVIEVVDRYRIDANGNVLGTVRYLDRENETDGYLTALGVMIWHTPEELSGRRYSYTSIGRTQIVDGAGSKTVFAFAFNNVEPGLSTFGLDGPGQRDADNPMGYGGVVIYDGPQTKVITEFTLPAVQANTYVGENPPGSGNYGFNLPIANEPTRQVKLTGIRSVNMSYVDIGGTPTLAVMVTTNTGIYELVETGPGVWEVRWMLNREAYSAMRRPRTAVTFSRTALSGNSTSFRPMYARRLESGDVLFVNGYVGEYVQKLPGDLAPGESASRPFYGEIALVDGTFAAPGAPIEEPGYHPLRPNLGFNSLSVLFELPPVQGIRGIMNPVFAERQ